MDLATTDEQSNLVLLTELVRGGSADTVVNLSTIEFRFGAVVLTVRNGVVGSYFGTHYYTISLFVILATE